MSNLLSAGVYRLKYSKLFYILLGLLVATLTLCYIQAIPPNGVAGRLSHGGGHPRGGIRYHGI